MFNDFGTILELLELYRAGLRYEPTQGFELIQGFGRTRGGVKNPKQSKICLGVQNLPRGSKFALGVKICPGVAVKFPISCRIV